jgi:hypothetical protein
MKVSLQHPVHGLFEARVADVVRAERMSREELVGELEEVYGGDGPDLSRYPKSVLVLMYAGTVPSEEEEPGPDAYDATDDMVRYDRNHPDSPWAY